MDFPRCCKRGCDRSGTIGVSHIKRGRMVYEMSCFKHLSTKTKSQVLEARANFNPPDRSKTP